MAWQASPRNSVWASYQRGMWTCWYDVSSNCPISTTRSRIGAASGLNATISAFSASRPRSFTAA